MKRRVTLRTTLYALIAAPSLLTALPVHAEDTPFISIVTGLAPDDLLNVRAKPSAIGKTEARIAAGASVRNLGCNDIDGRPWCKVESDNPKATGWTPARYLVPVNPAKVPNPDEATPATPIAAATDAVTPAAGGSAPAAAPPPDLTARLGDVTHAAAPEAPVKSAAATAMEDAYGLAMAAQDNPTTSEIKSPIEAPAPVATATVTPPPADPVAATAAPADPAPETSVAKADEQPVQEAAAEPMADTNAEDSPAPAANGIPVPTPRPGRKAEDPAIDPQTVARVEPPQPLAHAADATGEIPCARYVGQPMTRCEISIMRNGGDKADITVTWPDGGTRVISFYAGQPAGSNSRSDFRFTREGTLNMIRVGVAERFEITDSLALGD